jgi:murein DD-endopeptidase MepM/ murein hydrolase activator NlpD
VQLVCALVIFGAALVVKMALPNAAETVRAVLADGVGGGFDYRAAFATAGETLSAGGDIVTAFRVWTEELFGGRPAEADPPPPGGAGFETDPGAGSGADAGAGAELTPGSAPGTDFEMASETDFGPDFEPEAGPVFRPASVAGGEAGGRPVSDTARPARWDATETGAKAAAVWVSDWEVSLSAEDALDDTAPVAFGTEVPERADYTWYPLPFAHSAPVQGVVSSDFGFRRHPVYGETLFHYGLDLAADVGAEIRAFAAGTVRAAGVSDTYGYYLEIDHGDGFTSFYAHCDRLLAKAGQTVSLGERIARVGMTGLATGPHLHFELRLNGVSLAPGRYLESVAPLL